ncbi:hypothetical protein B0I27_109108 [Arcticibacter pallidicorallinus]|uniref:Uncharacterized protein n=1 Tax=Arcticibacter pallidicorallinus TaxID=1259464 RepID=A0A2T0TXH8_9SPHI|nr:hypothetical protein [Arcticibacter pallidicorallinus]PRY50385.1 hypothetical protein B0I27_109108 [Arcticibacter pallidicorallinus]
MRLPEFCHSLAERFAPMSERSSVELQTKASENYMKLLNQVEEKQRIIESNKTIQEAIDSPSISDAEKTLLLEKLQHAPKLTITEKVIELSEKWWFRYILSALFVYVQPKIQQYLNPAPDRQEPEYEENR